MLFSTVMCNKLFTLLFSIQRLKMTCFIQIKNVHDDWRAICVMLQQTTLRASILIKYLIRLFRMAFVWNLCILYFFLKAHTYLHQVFLRKNDLVQSKNVWIGSYMVIMVVENHDLDITVPSELEMTSRISFCSLF